MDTASSLFLSLPVDLLESISVCMSKASIKDHFSLKMTCRAMRDISELPPVYASVNLSDLDRGYWKSDRAFLKKCYDHGNPYAVFMKGCHDFFRFGGEDKGLATIRFAADKGYDVALYTHAMLQHILRDDSTHLKLLGREFILSISSGFVDRVRLWQPYLPASPTKQSLSEEDVYYLIHSCKCTSYDEWYYWYDKEAKGPEICEQCFWHREVAIFLKFFGSTAFVNTSEW